MTLSEPEPDSYPVVEIDANWATGPEQMGSKPKFWRQRADQEQLWLFKYPRPGSGEHWAEKLAAELAGCLRIPHAKVDLAAFRGQRGSLSRSFARRGRGLVHGNEFLAWRHPYDPDKRFGQSDHTLRNILDALEAVVTTEGGARTAKRRFAAYVVLDALIGNTDRHHENWGLLLRQIKSKLHGLLAPTFDHASSLGPELFDRTRQARLHDGTVGDYSERGRGGIFWMNSGRYGPSPLDLVRRAVTEYPALFQEPITRVGDRRSRFARIVRRVPDAWMSPVAKDFSVALLDYNATQLEQCLK